MATESEIRAEIRRYNAVRKRSHFRIFKRKVTTRFFMRLKDENQICELVVVHPRDPDQFVDSVVGDQHVRWPREDKGDHYIFRAPPGYAGGGINWSYNPKLQETEGMTEPQQKAFFLPKLYPHGETGPRERPANYDPPPVVDDCAVACAVAATTAFAAIANS